MRARTTILVYVQEPLSIFRLPPLYFGSLMISSMVPLFLFLFLGFPGLAILSSIIVFLVVGFFFYRITVGDCHADTVFRSGFIFYGFNKFLRNRVLKAGGIKK